MRSLRAMLEGDRADALREIGELQTSGTRDPETMFYGARHLARLEETARVIDMISEILDQNFICDFSLAQNPWLLSLRGHRHYGNIAQKAAERRREAHAAFVEAGGELILPSKTLTVP